jgi:hypothetical protein
VGTAFPKSGHASIESASDALRTSRNSGPSSRRFDHRFTDVNLNAIASLNNWIACLSGCGDEKYFF